MSDRIIELVCKSGKIKTEIKEEICFLANQLHDLVVEISDEFFDCISGNKTIIHVNCDNVQTQTDLAQSDSSTQTDVFLSDFLDLPQSESLLQRTSFASVVRRPIQRDNDRVVLVQSSSDNPLQPNQLREKLKENVDISTLGIQVRTTRLTRNGVAVSCASPEDANKLSEEINKQKNQFSARQPRLRLPKVIIPSIPNDWDTVDVIDNLVKCNNSIFSKNSDIKHLFKMRRITKFNTVTWVVEVPPHIRRAIYDNGDQLCLGWFSAFVRTFYSFKRCGRCYTYGHSTKDCKDNKFCGRCSSEGHDHVNCESDDYKCVNCVRYNLTCKDPKDHVSPFHPAWSTHCPCFDFQCSLSLSKEEPW